ncbi:hypothetical protein [Aeromonas hydrophila]|uniref:hypothetical protein n=1 Tax=Aeromonas hydrophila TaxID=644 RepID=UPI0011C8040E|nr:hypothetical protein [Aeromonas hydrophila]
MNMRNALGFAGAAAGSEFGPSVAMLDGVKQPDPGSMTEKAFFDGVTDKQMLDAVANVALQSARADAMAMVIEWVADGDDTAEGLDIYAQALADVDEDGEVSGDEEQAAYEQALTLMAEALVSLGVSVQVATDAMGGDDGAAAKAFVAAGDALDGDVDADDLISAFSVRESMMMDAVVKVIRDGKLKLIRKPLRKKRLSAAQRAALKKARMKANTAAARTARKKSMRMRKSRGM